jgi:hypothetical protein
MTIQDSNISLRTIYHVHYTQAFDDDQVIPLSLSALYIPAAGERQRENSVGRRNEVGYKKYFVISV